MARPRTPISAEEATRRLWQVCEMALHAADRADREAKHEDGRAPRPEKLQGTTADRNRTP